MLLWGRPLLSSDYNEVLVDIATELAQNPGVVSSCPAPSLGHVEMLVFISTGMPEDVLKDMFREVDNRTDVQFVLRGWDDLQQVGSRIMRAKGKNQVNVVVHPELFRGYGVDKVPVYLVRRGHNWFRVTGYVGVQKATELAGTLKNPKDPVGNIYDVAEPDMLEVIERRVAEYDWDSAIKQAQERFRHRWVSLVSIPPASGDGWVYHVDPTVLLMRDVMLDDGRIVLAAGTSVNPFDYVGLNQPIVVFNPQRACEMAFAKSYSQPAYFLATALSLDVMREFGREVFIATPEVVDRFRVTGTPAVVVQEGRMVRVETKPCVDR